MILVPCAYTLVVTIVLNDENSLLSKIVLGLAYLCCMLMTFYFLMATSVSDPGILPSVNQISLIPELSRNYPDPDRQYIVEYQDANQIRESTSACKSDTEKFFDKNKFYYIEDKNNATNPKNKLSFCKSCNIVRPPRAFHCPRCDFCVEIHDHHCPWTGTCVGYRNLKYFIAFLLSVATLSLFTAVLSAYKAFVQKK